MPALRVLGWRWRLGPDDLVWPSVAGLLARGALCGVLAAVAVGASRARACNHDSTGLALLLAVVWGSCGVFALSIACNVVIVRVSVRGSILGAHARDGLPRVLLVRLGLFVLEVGCVVGLLLLALRSSSLVPCLALSHLLPELRGVAIAAGVCLSVVALAAVCLFDCTGNTRGSEFAGDWEWRRRPSRAQLSDSLPRHPLHPNTITNYERVWYRRLRCLCCCARAAPHVYEEIAVLFAQYFQDLDVVPSDVAAALVILRRHQRLEEEEHVITALQRGQRVASLPPPLQAAVGRQRVGGGRQGRGRAGVVVKGQTLPRSTPLLPAMPGDKRALSDALHFLPYALGSYGWPLFALMRPLTACCRLSCGVCDSRVPGDNVCRCNATAARAQVKMHDPEIVYQSHENTLELKPYLIALDEPRQAIVLAMRGTLSITDCMTDALAETCELDLSPLSPLPHPSFPNPQPHTPPPPPAQPEPEQQSNAAPTYAHKGIANAAIAIDAHVRERGVLRAVAEAHPGFTVVVTGHSLGGGLAVLVALLLRRDGFFTQRVRCIAYSPPPVVNESTARAADDFAMSVVLGKDLVPRLSIRSMHEIRNSMVAHTARTQTPKASLLCSGCCCCCFPCACVGSRSFVHVSVDEIHPEVVRQMAGFEQRVEEGRVQLDAFHRPVSLAGRVLHVVKTHKVTTLRCCGAVASSKRVYQATWASASDFDRILVSRLMVEDHMPHILYKRLGEALEHLCAHESSASMVPAV